MLRPGEDLVISDLHHELQNTPKIVACSLSRGRYVTRTTLAARTPDSITRPFRPSWTQLTRPAALPESEGPGLGALRDFT